VVQITPDGKGLVILSSHSNGRLTIFEIYPQDEIPLLTQIADLDWFPSEDPVHFLPETLIFRVFYQDRIVFRVVDYRKNCSASFSAEVNVKKVVSKKYNVETFATKTAIIVFCKEAILIWAIPPLSPHPSDLSGFLDNNSTHMLSPLIKIPFPDGIGRNHNGILGWMMLSSWYFESWDSVYFSILYASKNFQRFKVIIKPDLSDASLHIITLSERIPEDLLLNSLEAYNDRVCDGYRICEDVVVYFWNNRKRWAVYTGLTSAPFTNLNVVARCSGYVLALCPTSGRFVYRLDVGKRIGVDDLF